MIVLTPVSYRDYKSRKAMMSDWNKNRFFEIASIGQNYGRTCTKSDAHRAGWGTVQIRFDRLTKFAIVTVKAVKPGEES